VITEAELCLCLSERWGLGNARIAVHNGGMGSATWYVDHDHDRWVA
jgi:hypothetical protein